jgi:hypothetical protein
MSEILVSPTVDEKSLFSGMTVDRLCIALRRGYLSEERTQYEEMYRLQGATREVLYAHFQRQLEARSGKGIECLTATCVPLLTSHDSDNGTLAVQVVASLHSEYKNGAKAAAYIWREAHEYASSDKGGYHTSLRVAATCAEYTALTRNVTTVSESVIALPPDELYIAGDVSDALRSDLGAVAARHGHSVVFAAMPLAAA